MLVQRFPLAYRDVLSAAADHAGIASGLFFALVREESYFQAHVKSASGAVGLSQLIPSTALDMARRMGMRAADLERPEDNLAIGSAYLAYCIRLFDSEFLGLLAYNAGLGRVRGWVKAYGDLPVPIMLEAIPFAETRMYVRKVVRSMIVYSFLYPSIATSRSLPVVLRGEDQGE